MILSKLSDLVKNDVIEKDVYNAKMKDIEDKIPNITNSVPANALTTVENKAPDHSKYITTSELKKLIVEHFAARLAQTNLAKKSDIANFVKMTDYDDKLKNLNKKHTLNKRKHVLIKKELNELSKNYQIS